MSEALPSPEESKTLYTLMKQVQVLAPWDWMEESDVFGIQHPETQELGFVSIMGMAGEHYAVSVYQGSRALYTFWRFEKEGPEVSPEELLEIPQLMASFEDREQLNKKDLDLIKSLGLKFRGKHAWPLFRGYRPGFFPWFIEAPEAKFLTLALEQVLDVAPRYQANKTLLAPGDDNQYLVRVSNKKGKQLVWEDQVKSVPPPSPAEITYKTDAKLLESLKQKPRRAISLEIDFSMFPSPVQEARDERPVFPYMLLILEASSGMLVGQEMLTPDPSLDAMWSTIPLHVMEALSKANVLPKEIAVRSPRLFEALKPVATALKVSLGRKRTLHGIDAVRSMLDEVMGRGFM